jgi:hypothetical protein
MAAIQPREIIDSFLSYWNEIRHSRKMPKRSDIDPRRIGRLLPYLTLLEVVRGGEIDPDFRICLVGEHVKQHSDDRLTGTLQSTHLSPDLHHRPVRAAYLRCLETKEPVVGKAEFLRKDEVPLAVHGAVCPLSSDGETVDCLLSAAVFLETPVEFALKRLGQLG